MRCVKDTCCIAMFSMYADGLSKVISNHPAKTPSGVCIAVRSTLLSSILESLTYFFV